MNAMIRVVRGTLAILAVAGVGLLLRWFTAGSISGLRTYDLDSLTVLAVGTIAWIAYGWLVLAVLLTVLEQIPGAIGTLAGAVAGRITTKTARTLLRSGLGVAAVTPLTISAAQATPAAHVHEWTQPSAATDTNFRATEPRSKVQLGDTSQHATQPQSSAQPGNADTSYRATEPASSVEIGGAASDAQDFRATEPASTVQIAPETDQHTDDYRATEPRSTVEIGNSGTPQTPQSHTDFRATEPPSKLRLGSTPTPTDDPTARPTSPHPGVPTRPTTPGTTTPSPTTPGTTTPSTTSRMAKPGHATGGTPAPDRSRTSDRPAVPGDSTSSPPRQTGAGRRADGPADRPTAGPARVGVPDRPTDGAPTRYTELRAAVPVRVVVREGDSLWSIAARELGPGATTEAIAARWPDWYAANRHVIGDDPDLILPGQVLRIPPAPTGNHLPPHHQEQ